MNPHPPTLVPRNENESYEVRNGRDAQRFIPETASHAMVMPSGRIGVADNGDGRLGNRRDAQRFIPETASHAMVMPSGRIGVADNGDGRLGNRLPAPGLPTSQPTIQTTSQPTQSSFHGDFLATRRAVPSYGLIDQGFNQLGYGLIDQGFNQLGYGLIDQGFNQLGYGLIDQGFNQLGSNDGIGAEIQVEPQPISIHPIV